MDAYKPMEEYGTMSMDKVHSHDDVPDTRNDFVSNGTNGQPKRKFKCYSHILCGGAAKHFWFNGLFCIDLVTES